MAKQRALGDELFGTPMDTKPAPADDPAPVADLDAIQADSEKQALPDQDKIFRVAPRVRSKLHNLPDPAKPPLGFVNGRGFDVVFPFIKLPDLSPNMNGDWVQFGSPDLEPNRLYYGDNLQVLRTLPSNSIDLIYIDPPFFSGAIYNVIWGDTNEVRTFSDIWEGGLDTYLIWLNARLWEMRRVLKDTGSIYIHCDWHASHYIKAEMDKIFGYANFRSEIVWKSTSAHANNSTYGNIHQSLLFFTKTSDFTFNTQHTPYDAEYADTYYRYRDADGRRFMSGDLVGHQGVNPEYDWRGIRRPWRFPKERLDELDTSGKIFWTRNNFPRLKRYLDEMPGMPAQSIWTDKSVQYIVSWSDEGIGYPTQKPIGLLSRIIEASSNPGDTVADFFCGGGTTPTAAQSVGRKWIACDSSRIAVSVTLNRLVALGEAKSGVSSNYGKPEQLQTKMDLPTSDATVPDIRVHYVGVYPMDRFKAVDQPEFDRFVLKCLDAQSDNSDNAITGWRSAREPLCVGPADPDEAPDPKHLQAFFNAVVHQLQTNVRTIARYACWRTSPELVAYRKQLSGYVRKNIQPRGVDLDIDFLLIDSEDFRERIRAKYPDADDNEFLLRFTKEPVVGEIAVTSLGNRKCRFEARDADSTNVGGYLVNCQWDFDYQRGHFAAHRDYVLGRTELKGKEAKVAGRKYEAKLDAEHEFDKPGAYTVACRVQDNLGAETVRTLAVEIP